MEKTKTVTVPSGDTRTVIRFGLFVVFFVFGILGGWMYLAPLATSSVALGKVSAGSDKKVVQHLEGGIVEAIYVKDGDMVQEGDTLLKLQDIQVKETLNMMEAQYQEATALLARLVAQRDNAKSVSFLPETTDRNAIKTQQHIFTTTMKLIHDEKMIAQQRRVQLKNQIKGTQALLNSKRNRLHSLKNESKEWQVLFEQQLVDKVRIRELERESNMIKGEIANANSEVSKLQEQISEIKTQQLLREKEFKKETLNQLVQVKSEVSDLKSKIIATKDTLQRTEVKSPATGIVVGLGIHTIGAVIGPGNEILNIVPEDSKLIVLAQVNTTDIDKVQTGLLADIMFSAFNLQQVHVIEGEVVHISADSFIDEMTGAPYYEAKIEVTAKGMKQLQDYGFTLVAGMPADVMIKTGSRTALSYLIKPFMDMLTKGFNEE